MLQRDSGRLTPTVADALLATTTRSATKLQSKASAPLATRTRELSLAAAGSFVRSAERCLQAALGGGAARSCAALQRVTLAALQAVSEPLKDHIKARTARCCAGNAAREILLPVAVDAPRDMHNTCRKTLPSTCQSSATT